MASESLLKNMKNAFYFTLKALFILKVFKYLSWLFGHVGKRLHKKDQVNFKIIDVRTWFTNIYNTHIYQYVYWYMKWRQSGNEIWPVNIFLENSYAKCGRETIPRPFSQKTKLGISLEQYPKDLYVLFLFFAKLRTIESDWN